MTRSSKLVVNCSAILFFLSVLLLHCGDFLAQEHTGLLSLEQERQAALENLGATKVFSFEAVRSIATQLFARPLEQQNQTELKKFANGTNQYDLIQEKAIGLAQNYGDNFLNFISIRRIRTIRKNFLTS